ncbi:MAG: hypothetical protein KA956_13800 [Pyrinomonadaceae bacterium]|nr:hypothetical protein [Pyrinomonadaceae bacterium]
MTERLGIGWMRMVGLGLTGLKWGDDGALGIVISNGKAGRRWVFDGNGQG